MRRATPLLLTAAGIAWLARQEHNPAQWPAYLRDWGGEIIRDVRDAAADGGRAGLRAERAFDNDLATARPGARTQ